MDGCNFDRPRNVIPRWRTFSTTVESGELGGPPKESRGAGQVPGDLARRVESWRPNVPSVYSADLVSSALVFGHREEALDAARSLLAHEGPNSAFQRLVAERLLSGQAPPRSVAAGVSSKGQAPRQVQSRISTERQLLRYAPNNPIAWTELAHAYTAIGRAAKARRCLQTARQLAPENRYVLRSATRFWIHDGDAEHGLWILRRSARTRSDPWLLAAEVATSTVCEQVSREAKRADRLLKAQGEPSIHFSELAAALGVLEFQHGHTRRARNLFYKALRQPTENAVTQAIWFNRFIRNTRLENAIREHLSVPRGYEALAWVRFVEGTWDQAVAAYEGWLNDEPFASRPAIDGSYLATLALEDHERAQTIAVAGLRANPGDHRLENNLAVAQLHLNQVETAKKIVARLPRLVDDVRAQATMTATRGLLEFREGRTEAGAQLYLGAADEAAKNSLKDVETQALLIGALVGIESGLSGGHPLLNRASRRASERLEGSAALTLLQTRVKEALERTCMRDGSSSS